MQIELTAKNFQTGQVFTYTATVADAAEAQTVFDEFLAYSSEHAVCMAVFVKDTLTNNLLHMGFANVASPTVPPVDVLP